MSFSVPSKGDSEGVSLICIFKNRLFIVAFKQTQGAGFESLEGLKPPEPHGFRAEAFSGTSVGTSGLT